MHHSIIWIKNVERNVVLVCCNPEIGRVKRMMLVVLKLSQKVQIIIVEHDKISVTESQFTKTISGSLFHHEPLDLSSSSSFRGYSGSEYDTGSESTDSLLEEAQQYLKVAKTKLVTIEDWSKIQEEKQIRKKLKKRVRHSPNVVSFCKIL